MRFHGYFYPRPPRGGRRSAPLFRPSSRNYFYPRPPRGGRRQARSGRQVAQDISIHALREEGDYTVQIVHVGAVISIHALREEGDLFFDVPMLKTIDFYPRPPRGGRRDNGGVVLVSVGFLSTPSARRATCPLAGVIFLQRKFLSTPSARRATVRRTRAISARHISIHALREEGDAV